MADENLSSSDSRSSADNSRYLPPDEQTSSEELHRLLASDRRRCLLSYLSTEASDPVSRDELIDVIAERERPDPGPATHRVRVTIDLHHVHLPKLADAGVIEYDPVAETVSYKGSDRLESLLATSIAIEESE